MSETATTTRPAVPSSSCSPSSLRSWRLMPAAAWPATAPRMAPPAAVPARRPPPTAAKGDSTTTSPAARPTPPPTTPPPPRARPPAAPGRRLMLLDDPRLALVGALDDGGVVGVDQPRLGVQVADQLVVGLGVGDVVVDAHHHQKRVNGHGTTLSRVPIGARRAIAARAP